MAEKNIFIITSSLESGVIDKSAIDVALTLSAHGFNITVASAGGKMVKELKKQGIEHILLPLNSNDIFVMRRNLKKIIEIANVRKISMMHTFTPQSSFYGFRASKLLKIPYITSFLKIYKKPFWHLFNRTQYMTRGIFVIAPSDFMAGYIQSTYRIAAEKIIIVPQWIDTEVYNANNVSAERIIATASDLRIPEDHFIITTIDKLEKAHGQAQLVAAIAKTPALKNKVRCLIVGQGGESKRYRSELEFQAERMGVKDVVHVVMDANLDIPALLMLSDVYVATNTQPMASHINLLQAQSLGRPIIASNIGSTPEYILDDVSCRMYEPKNADDLAAAILWAMDLDEAKRADISHKLASNIRLNFSRGTLPAKIGNIYNYILESRR
ncbi:MAG: glycosyltransferase [Rickettsiales bacterium]|jgi:glycosyltransferase involved in cell wall biosynthesis|nr:glycosyltransferase [Rickettsiales bacterium]